MAKMNGKAAPRPRGPHDDWLDVPSYGFCRAAQHPWEEKKLSFDGRAHMVWVLVCQKCGTVRIDKVKRSDGDVSRQYKHAKGYLIQLAKGEKRPLKAVIRAEYFAYRASLKHL